MRISAKSLRGATPATPPNRAATRLAKLKESMNAKKTTATSAAHVGVVARPMNKNLSTKLEAKRAELQGPGTSVARMGKTDITQDPAERGTSVARIQKRAHDAPSYLPAPLPKPPTARPDLFGDVS